MRPADRAIVVAVTGVAGSGKTTLARALAAHLGWRWLEGDDLHPPDNLAKMRAGVPLDDGDRAGWLDAIGAAATAPWRAGASLVLTCSALKRSYRDRLRAFVPTLRCLHLALDRESARERVAARPGHPFPVSLVDSQFAALEPIGPDEAALVLDARQPTRELVSLAAEFALRPGP